MLKVTLTGQTAVNQQLNALLASEVKLLATTLYNEVRKRTPVDTGKARSGWIKSDKVNGFSIENKVPYVPILDKGRHMTNRGMRGSVQAPKGIIGPSLDTIKRKN
jgi:hypothetical protein